MNVQIEITELKNNGNINKVGKLKWVVHDELHVLGFNDLSKLSFNELKESEIYFGLEGYVFFEDGKWWHAEPEYADIEDELENMIYNYLQEGLTLKQAFGIISL